jgi:hypothetical protein
MPAKKPSIDHDQTLLASTWILVCGYASGILSILFFMGYIIFLTYSNITEIPNDIKNLIDIVFSLSIGLSFSFIGGHAAVKGKIEIPYIKQNPILFSAGGGIAAFLITLILSHYLFHPINPTPNSSRFISGSAVLRDGFSDPGKSGFNFKKQKSVDWYSGEADILAANPNRSNNPDNIAASLNNTGILLFTQHDQPPFYNNPTGIDDAYGALTETSYPTLEGNQPCPLEGYTFHWTTPKKNIIYCLRTRDGKSYVKFIINKITPDRITFEYILREDGKNNFDTKTSKH